MVSNESEIQQVFTDIGEFMEENRESVLENIPLTNSDDLSYTHEDVDFFIPSSESEEEKRLESFDMLQCSLLQTDSIVKLGSEISDDSVLEQDKYELNGRGSYSNQSAQTKTVEPVLTISNALLESIREIVKAELYLEKSAYESKIQAGVECEICKADPIIGVIYHCQVCDYFLCQACEDNVDHSHPLIKIKFTANKTKPRASSSLVIEPLKKPIIQPQQESRKITYLPIDVDYSGAMFKRPTGKQLKKLIADLKLRGFTNTHKCMSALAKSKYDIKCSAEILLKGK
ncbi:unnamed protein product [Blepharisma stoltei]|uniref:ZZ-type domain-containing protein n=1 Tax=Blepharisma stoltei TaxID=1481888 RepID=A0AAU9IS42_9CILI|nr:unnamed protein product [Blepharisma stoltei]